ncbi:hypothetical protein PHMEG_00031777 [Phytophthora megakarya]|uniref:Sulfatase N-terminal domain-containing protein n=1 Tax=Phytophthora megakarya TaxID=4795 RepID=A0A225UW28_9STRA|nr:hypothetical protein PHMEG_00031777 [Phytophthora megakarya]
MEHRAPEKKLCSYDGERRELFEISIKNVEIDPEADPVDVNAKKLQPATWKEPWLGWCFAYVFVLVFFSAYRWVTIDTLMAMYGDVKEISLSVEIGVRVLGLLEDVVCATYFVCILWVFDLAVQAVKKRYKFQGGRTNNSFEKQTRIARLVSKIATFLVSWLSFVMMMMPFVGDMLLIHFRQIRLSFDLMKMVITERDYISAAPIARSEFDAGYMNGAVVIIAATLFATAAVLFMGLVGFPILVIAISSSCSPIVAYSAMNMPLNLVFPDILLPAPEKITRQDIAYNVIALAENHMNISYENWVGPDARRFPWGVHDDISFQIVGDLLVNKTIEQSARTARGEPKKPMFITHYTISSHEPFKAKPRWYEEMEKPDFGGLFWSEKRALSTKNYLEMRYFTDLELGKFMDRMEKEGVLNDTIVVILGDHGRAPEVQGSDTRALSVTRVPATIIAEGRLGESVGLMIDDAVEQYDILNTLADITGVPEGGFLQDGVGRSLKRKIPFGERVVFSNNPAHKMSIVRGHQRLQYDRVADSVLLHNTDTDHDMHVDLFPNLTTEEQINCTSAS